MRAFVVHPTDTVATMVDDAVPGPVQIHGAFATTCLVAQAISIGHKIAIRPMMPHELVIKWGIPIGIATREIAPGEWVHMHNCKSGLDARSNRFEMKPQQMPEASND
jgi:hypothetical protein